ncbi:hypothetical protein J3B02_006228, partial [Coemansia erecta]
MSWSDSMSSSITLTGSRVNVPRQHRRASRLARARGLGAAANNTNDGNNSNNQTLQRLVRELHESRIEEIDEIEEEPEEEPFEPLSEALAAPD